MNKTFLFTFKNNDEIIDYMLNTYMPSELDSALHNSLLAYKETVDKSWGNGKKYGKYNPYHILAFNFPNHYKPNTRDKQFLKILNNMNIIEKLSPKYNNVYHLSLNPTNVVSKSYEHYDFFTKTNANKFTIRIGLEFIFKVLDVDIESIKFGFIEKDNLS